MDLGNIRRLIEPVIEPLGYELVDVRFVVDQGRPTLRVLIDGVSTNQHRRCVEGEAPAALPTEGATRAPITVGDCEQVSREIETLLEVEAVVPEKYLLEVSSPGLNRPLVQEKDFVRFAGKSASLTTTEPIDGRRNYKGLLRGVEESKVVMEIDGKEYRVPLKLIGKANLCYKI